MDGKANRLAALIRSNLGMAMQGLAVVPLFAGYDLNHDQGRIFSYDVTGGRYEETAFHSVGSGSLFARGSLKKLYREDFTAEQTVQAVIEALYDAADDDSATGGPDITRRIFPVVQVITADGYRRLPDDRGRRDRGPRDRRADEPPRRPAAPLTGADSMNSPQKTTARRPGAPDEHAVLRLARAADEGPGGLRAQGHRPRPVRGRRAVRRRRPVRLREPLAGAAQGLRDLRPDRLRGGRSLQRVREPADRRRAAGRHARLRLRPARRDRPRAGQRLRADRSARSSPAAARSPTRWRSSWPRSATWPRTTRSTG